MTEGLTEPVTVDVPGLGPVEQRRGELTAVDLPLVSFRSTYRFLNDNTTLTSDSTLRFRDRDELTTSLETEGFDIREIREAPDRPCPLLPRDGDRLKAHREPRVRSQGRRCSVLRVGRATRQCDGAGARRGKSVSQYAPWWAWEPELKATAITSRAANSTEASS